MTYMTTKIWKNWKKKLSTYLIGGWSFKWKRDENAPAFGGIPALSSDSLIILLVSIIFVKPYSYTIG